MKEQSDGKGYTEVTKAGMRGHIREAAWPPLAGDLLRSSMMNGPRDLFLLSSSVLALTFSLFSYLFAILAFKKREVVRFCLRV